MGLLACRQAADIKRHLGCIQHRPAHIHGHAAIIRQPWSNHSGLGLHTDFGLAGQAFVIHVARKAACPIAALLDFTAIGVMDHIFKIQAIGWRRAHRQNLVGTYAKVAIGQKTVVRWRQAQLALCFIEHDKVIARALHFGEANVHGAVRSMRGHGHAKVIDMSACCLHLFSGNMRQGQVRIICLSALCAMKKTGRSRSVSAWQSVITAQSC